MIVAKKTRMSDKRTKHKGSNRAVGDGISAPKQKLVVSAKSTIKAKRVSKVERLAENKEIWLLTGTNNERVVVKIESGSGTETPSEFRGRVEAVNYLAKGVLPRVPQSYRLDVNELDQLIDIAEQHKDDTFSGSLKKLSQTRGKLGKTKDNTTPIDAIVKMEYIPMGDNLLDRAKAPSSTGPGVNQAQELLQGANADEIWTDLGRMAAFDLVVVNSDRFASDGYVGLENIDFSNGDPPQLVPLDNVDKKAAVKTYNVDPGNDAFQNTGNLHPALYAPLSDNKAVLAYSQATVSSIGKQIGAQFNVTADQPGPELEKFMAGFNEGKQTLSDTVHSKKPPAIEKAKVAPETTAHWQWLRGRMENIGAGPDSDPS